MPDVRIKEHKSRRHICNKCRQAMTTRYVYLYGRKSETQHQHAGSSAAHRQKIEYCKPCDGEPSLPSWAVKKKAA
jgi:hypothetical protein